MGKYVAAIDQGTTSTRCIVFDAQGAIVALAQKEHQQIYPQPGWVEHSPAEIAGNTQEVIAAALQRAKLTAGDLVAVGITNQRETTVVWDRSGRPIHNALVWQDTRVDPLVAFYSGQGGKDRFRASTGLPLASYFSGLKLQWLLDNVPGARQRAQAGELLFGTIDSWVLWNLTGGAQGGLHVTDVTNASRTQLMRLDTLAWDDELLNAFSIPRSLLPRIASSSEVYGEVATGPLRGVPIAGILGDQQAALVGQACFQQGEAKNTYGTGCFMLMNTGETPYPSKCGLLTTVGYRFGQGKPVYALEGSIAIAGALVQWLRDNLGLIQNSTEIETLARGVEDNGGVTIVPAFSGLYAPHWNSHARGLIGGLTRFANKGHIARAALEATAFQTREVLEAMTKDTDIAVKELRTDGGMVVNELLMQFQADILNVPVVRPKVIETTALGAAYAAGLATGFWSGTDELVRNWAVDKRWTPAMEASRRERLNAVWDKAIARSLDWAD
jgi:glycerol kinase